jgi:hypothetical protein
MPSQHSDTRKPWGPGGALGQLQHLWLSGMGQHSWSLIPSLSMLRELIVHDFRVLPITAGSWTTEAAVKTDRRTGEPIVLDLAHSPAVYQMRYRFRSGYLLWRYPREAWAALREVMPWEALAVSLCVCLAVGIRFGQDLGVTAGVCMSLALVTVQLLRTRAFATPSRIVRERGLLVMSRSEIDVASISDAGSSTPKAHETRSETSCSSQVKERRACGQCGIRKQFSVNYWRSAPPNELREKREWRGVRTNGYS